MAHERDATWIVLLEDPPSVLWFSSKTVVLFLLSPFKKYIAFYSQGDVYHDSVGIQKNKEIPKDMVSPTKFSILRMSAVN